MSTYKNLLDLQAVLQSLLIAHKYLNKFPLIKNNVALTIYQTRNAIKAEYDKYVNYRGLKVSYGNGSEGTIVKVYGLNEESELCFLVKNNETENISIQPLSDLLFF